MKNKAVWAVAAFALVLSGCGATRIGNILSNPTRYANRNVQVSGQVTQSVGAIVAGYYQVDDGTGKIGVIGTGNVPPKGSRVSVSGNVNNGITLGSRSFGTVIRERDRRVSR